RRLAFASARREADGKYSAQDLWLADLGAPRLLADQPAAAAAPGGGAPPPPPPHAPAPQRHQA
ncbi:hypothetical protein, partial [Sagittula sp.]|uniref:hypothetical protein n=1 Tax=Sagittula sp. TaxID=2038081 RepID=UPI004059B9D3